MATYTVKPAGGGDYTTLAAAWTARKGEAAAPWFEFYAGDCGTLDMTATGVGFTPTASNYVRIYPGAGGRHNGISATSGGYIANSAAVYSLRTYLSYTRIEGLAFSQTTAGGYGCASFNCSHVLMDGLLATNSRAVTFYSLGYGYNSVSGLVARNCVQNGIVPAGSVAVFIQANALTAGHTLSCELDNCTFNGAGSGSTRGVFVNPHNGATINITAKNVVCVGATAGDFVVSEAPANWTCANNVSSDATADDFGGTGNLVNQAATDLFVDPAGGDFTPKAGSALIDAGADLSADFTDDILGNARPSGAAWDIGAFEVQQAVAVAGGTLINGGLINRGLVNAGLL